VLQQLGSVVVCTLALTPLALGYRALTPPPRSPGAIAQTPPHLTGLGPPSAAAAAPVTTAHLAVAAAAATLWAARPHAAPPGRTGARATPLRGRRVAARDPRRRHHPHRRCGVPPPPRAGWG